MVLNLCVNPMTGQRFYEPATDASQHGTVRRAVTRSALVEWPPEDHFIERPRWQSGSPVCATAMFNP